MANEFFWIKYRRKSSAGPGSWEYKELAYDKDGKYTREDEANAFIRELNDSQFNGEHYRGYEWEIIFDLPIEYIDTIIKNCERSVNALNEKIIRLTDMKQALKKRAERFAWGPDDIEIK